MNKLIMGIAALVLITAPARAVAQNTPSSQAFMDALARIPDAEATRLRKERERRAANPRPQIIKVYVYSIPVGGPIAPRPKPQAAPKPAPQFKPAPRTQAVKLEER